jgi:RluA family pseudouridine synthase
MKRNTGELVLYQDRDLLVINKPAGLLVLPDGYDPEATHVKDILTPEFGDLWIVHRLDRQTSGVLLLARTPEAHRALNIQFENRQVTKVYHALVSGVPEWTRQTVELPLRADGDRRHRTVVDHHQGKAASTHFRVLERFGDYALIAAAPQTGRTHQIRVHLATLEHPIVVDDLYGDGQDLYLSQFKRNYNASGRKPERPLLGRLGLHAFSMDFVHPKRKRNMAFRAAYPKDFAAAVQQLRKDGQS